MEENGKLIGILIIVGLVVILLFVALFAFGFHHIGTTNEAAQTQDYKAQLEHERKKRELLEEKVNTLTADNERLAAQLKGGLDLAEERKSLDTKEKDLKRREKLLQDQETTFLIQKEDFFTRVKSTEQDYGKALHAEKEFQNMRAERNEALASRENWLRWFYGTLIVSILIVLSVTVYLVLIIWKYRHRNETQRQAVDLVRSVVSARVDPQHARQILDAFTQVATAQDEGPKALPHKGS